MIFYEDFSIETRFEAVSFFSQRNFYQLLHQFIQIIYEHGEDFLI